MIDRYCERYGRRPKGVAADNTYGNGEMLQWLDERGITPYIRVKEGPNSPSDLYGIEKFTYVPEENCYLCPAGKHCEVFVHIFECGYVFELLLRNGVFLAFEQFLRSLPPSAEVVFVKHHEVPIHR